MTKGEHPDAGFLSRWSERKLKFRGGEQPSEPAGDAAQADDPMEPVESQEASRPVLTDADMPPLESLDAHSDYSGFLSRGVSEALRRQALSKLFRSAHLNVTDGLDDYAEDFTKFTPLGDLVTADMRHRMEQAARRLLEEGEEAERVVARATERDREPARTADSDGARFEQEPTEGEEA